MGLYAVGTPPSVTNLPASKQIYSSPANAAMLGLSSNYAGGNLPPSPIIGYGAFGGAVAGDEPDGTAAAFPVILGPGQFGMVAHRLVSQRSSGGRPGWPYGNGGHAT